MNIQNLSSTALRKRRHKLVRDLPPVEQLLRGSLIETYKRCGRPNCHCVDGPGHRSEEHTSELQSLRQLVCRLLLEKKEAGGKIQRRRAGGPGGQSGLARAAGGRVAPSGCWRWRKNAAAPGRRAWRSICFFLRSRWPQVFPPFPYTASSI